MIPITLTRAGRVIGHYSLYDIRDGDDYLWAAIQIAFANDRIRSITRTNDEWRVDLDE